MKFDRKKFAANMRAERARAGITQEELAQKSGVSVATIQNYERGESTPNLDLVCMIAGAISTTPNYLLGLDRGEVD